MKKLTLSIIMIMALTLAVHGATIVVDLAGGGDYTNIHDAVDAADDGDTVLVMSGTYIIGPENGVINVDKELHLLGSGYDLPGEGGTKIQSSLEILHFESTADGSTLRGFRMYGYGNPLINISADDMIIEENHFTNSQTNGILMMFNSGVSSDTLRNNIIGNISNANWFYTVRLNTTTNLAVTNNIFFMGAYYGAVALNANTGALVSNNVFLNCYAGVNSAGSATVVNNIFMNGGAGGQIQGAPSASYNSFFNNGADGTTGIEPILENPDFVDYGDNDSYTYLSIDDDDFDFHLQSASPCIDGGNPLFDYFDLDGSRNDLGVYGWRFPIGTTGAPTIPVVNSISVTPSTVSPSGTITINASGRIGE